MKLDASIRRFFWPWCICLFVDKFVSRLVRGKIFCFITGTHPYKLLFPGLMMVFEREVFLLSPSTYVF